MMRSNKSGIKDMEMAMVIVVVVKSGGGLVKV